MGADRWNPHLPLLDVGTPAADLDQIVRLARRWADDLLHVWKISGCRGPEPATGKRCLTLEASRENLVPGRECRLGLEVRIDETKASLDELAQKDETITAQLTAERKRLETRSSAALSGASNAGDNVNNS